MCGLFGWAGVKSENFNYTKLKLMGLLNDERGGDGFGMFNGLHTYKSVTPGRLKEGLKDPKKLIELVPSTFPIFMGHTRRKSTGRIDMDHTQPIQWVTGEFESCIMHNGTIDYLKALVKDVEMETILPNIEGFSDTQVLARILHELKLSNRPLSEVLNRYSGSAALLIYFNSEPNGFYVFRGGSKWYNYSTSFTEERPLYFSVEKGKGIYISSLEESLSYIAEGEDFIKPVEIPLNTLFRVEGDTMVEVEAVKRDTVYRYSTPENKKSTYCGYGECGDEYDDDYYKNWGKTSNYNKNLPVVNNAPKTEFINRDGISMRKSPTHEYLATYFTDFYALARDKFRGNHVAALEYLSEAFPATSILKFSPKLLEKDKEGKSKISFYKGRYVNIYGTTENPWGTLANGIFFTDSKGKIYYRDIPESGDIMKVAFKHGVLVSMADSTFVQNVLSDTFGTASNYSNSLVKFEYNSLFGNTSMMYKHLIEPIALLHQGGKLYIPTGEDRTSLIPYSGRYEPLYGNIGYNVQDGIVTSSYIITPTGVEKKSEKEKVAFKPTISSKILCLCPECFGESALCQICGGDGYINPSTLESYKKLEVPDDDYDTLVNQSVVEEVQELSTKVCETRNVIMSMGDTTLFLEKVVSLLDEFERNLIDAMSNG